MQDKCSLDSLSNKYVSIYIVLLLLTLLFTTMYYYHIIMPKINKSRESSKPKMI